MSATTDTASSLRVRTVEWPTVVLIAAVYLTLGLLAWHHKALAWWVILPIGAYAAALQSSLQHEVLHGHPTRNRTINELLIFPTAHFWLPFGRYRDTHLAHHNDAHLTDPILDPESYYLLPDDWRKVQGIKRVLFTCNQTLGGRMLIGPAVSVARFWSTEWLAIYNGDRTMLRSWAVFAASCAGSFTYIAVICGMPFWQYIVMVAYPGISLALVRSFCEHQAVENLGERTIIVEASPFWSLLFLNNNLHLAHHARPGLAWYKLPAYYFAERQNLIATNNGYLMKGYREVFRRYFVTAKEPVAYPNVDWLKR